LADIGDIVELPVADQAGRGLSRDQNDQGSARGGDEGP
jgi:hypothetical protein